MIIVISVMKVRKEKSPLAVIEKVSERVSVSASE